MLTCTFLFLALLGSFSCSADLQKPANSIIGMECDPPRDLVGNACGRETFVGTTSVSVPNFLHGPNVCRISDEYAINVRMYKLDNYCKHVLHEKKYYSYQCTPVCMPTSSCSNRNRTFQRHYIECCENFISREYHGNRLSQDYETLFNSYYKPAVEQLPPGCPIARGANVSQCMDLLGLSEFGSLMFNLSVFNIVDITELGHGALTFFVPTNEALESLSLSTEEEVNEFVGNHVINGTVELMNLTGKGQFLTLSGSRLRSSAVMFLFKGSHSKLATEHPIEHTSIRFINGARVLNPDACKSKGITLHVIDRALMPGQMTLAAILNGRSDLSMFAELLQFNRVLKFLDKEDGESRTVFAPTNDVFNEQIPPELFDCLMYKRNLLHDIALYHILDSAEYSSSLARQATVHTQLQIRIRVNVNEADNITFATNPETSVTEANISAANGVLHIINRVLIPPDLKLGTCASLVPTEPPVTPTPTILSETTSMDISTSIESVVPMPTSMNTETESSVIDPTESVVPTPISMNTGIDSFSNNP